MSVSTRPDSLLLKRVERFGRAGGFEHLITEPAEHRAAKQTDGGFVFDHQHDAGFCG